MLFTFQIIWHKLKNVINVVWQKKMISNFTKLSFIYGIVKRNLKNWKKR